MRCLGDLHLDSPGHVPWWRTAEVTLFAILVHLLTETSRHAGHADILREQLDGAIETSASRGGPSSANVALPAAGAPFRHRGALGAQGAVVAVPRVNPGGIFEDVENARL